MVKTKSLLMRSIAGASVVALAVAGIVPGLIGTAKAALVDERSIYMYSSAASANTTYHVSFRLPTVHSNLEGIVVEFCAETPIINDTTCTKPAGFSVNTSPTFDNVFINAAENGGSELTANWTAEDLDTGHTFVLYDADSALETTLNDYVTFDITSITNPSATNTSFYARIYTYDDSDGALGYTVANPDVVDAHIDDGGIALSTANQITITTKVQERLTFCVYTSAVNCAGGGNSIWLGDTNHVLDPDHSYVNVETKFDIATNAMYNAVVVMKGATLTSGGQTITAIGNTGATYTANTEMFGMCAYQSTGTGLTIEAPYADAVNCIAGDPPTAGINGDNGATYAFNDAATTGGTNHYGGDTIATKVPGTSSTAVLNFMAGIDYVTQAGIYSTTLDFIATGEF